jgi:hypothetical protein
MTTRGMIGIALTLFCASGQSGDETKLARARRVNLAYAGSMPSYVADEIANRYTSGPKSSKWQPLDTVETEITIEGTRAIRRQIRRNGRPWDQAFDALPGFRWYGGFGTEIRPVFDPACGATLEYQGRADVRGSRLMRFLFTAPADSCFAVLFMNGKQANPPRLGHVFIDETTGNVMQYEEEANDLPADFGMTQRTEQVSWSNVRIGDATHLLPVAASFMVRYATGARAKIELEFRNHRHFEASSHIAFPK